MNVLNSNLPVLSITSLNAFRGIVGISLLERKGGSDPKHMYANPHGEPIPKLKFVNIGADFFSSSFRLSAVLLWKRMGLLLGIGPSGNVRFIISCKILKSLRGTMMPPLVIVGERERGYSFWMTDTQSQSLIRSCTGNLMSVPGFSGTPTKLSSAKTDKRPLGCRRSLV